MLNFRKWLFWSRVCTLFYICCPNFTEIAQNGTEIIEEKIFTMATYRHLKFAKF